MGWRRVDRILIRPVILISVVMPLYLLSVVSGWNESPVEEMFGGRRNFGLVVAVVFPLSYGYLTGLYRARRRRWVKLFEVDHGKMSAVVETILKEYRLPFTMMSRAGILPRFPIRYAEGYTIDGGRIVIRIQHVLDDVSILEIGPVYEGKEIEKLGIDVLRERIDATLDTRGGQD